MTTENDNTSQLKRALQSLKDLRTRLENVEKARREPIAVIGMACRFPGGANSPQAYWQVLKNRVDGIVAVPPDRWDGQALFDADSGTPGKVATRWGGFLPEVDHFDAPFFGISPREATRMDPQQRLLLEVAWEAFENAGIPIEKLSGSRTGVFVGVHSHSTDYYLMQSQEPDEMDIYTGTGTSHSVISGRISYFFDLTGPNIALDTACSSSLSAVHLAVQSLRSGECSQALAGGVNVMLTPHFTIMTSKMRMLSPDGRCKAFDSRADGIGRGEGCGAVILKRLSDAERDGDTILSVIRGSAINQDGRSNGLTAPNGLSQQAVIRDALNNAGVKPGQISYVETHGTGTPLGDPIEVEALSEVYGQPDPHQIPCLLGSAKTNLGHLEGAAGIAGFMKTVLSLQNGTIPANLHFKELNPHISLAGTRLQIASEERVWDSGVEPRRAGVSAFGWSGTNVHMIVEEYQPEERISHSLTGEVQSSAPTIVPISARSAEALKELASAFQSEINRHETALADLSYSAALHRSHHELRLAAVGYSTEDMVEPLAAFERGENHPRLFVGRVSENPKPAIIFVYSGVGGHWTGMGRQLLARDPIFRQVIEQCEISFRPYVNWNLIEQLTADHLNSRLDEIDVVQPCTFAIQSALTASLKARGIIPDMVIGHSMGEVAAAYVSGALSLEDAAAVICTRSRLMRRVSGKGAMAVVGLSLEMADALLTDYRSRVSIAVSNSPTSTVLSGDPDALEEVLARLRAQNIFTRAVNVDVATHSPQMDSLRPELVSALSAIQPQPTHIPLYSTVVGALVEGTSLDAHYWGMNLRQPVLFSSTIENVIAQGYDIFIECGPHPLLLPAIAQAERPEQAHNAPLTLLPAMRRAEDEQMVLQSVAAGLYTAGVSLDWQKVLPQRGHIINLPAYPWQRKRYWIKTKSNAFDPLAAWFYQVDWVAQDNQPIQSSSSLGTWLVFCASGHRTDAGRQLADRIAARGGRAVCVSLGQAFSQESRDAFIVDPHQPEHFQQVLSDICGDRPALQGVAYLWGLHAPQIEQIDLATLQESQRILLEGALHLVQALAGIAWLPGGSPRLWLITRQAQPVAGSRPLGLAQSTLWGFGRVAAFEHPDLWGGLIDMDDLPADRLIADFMTESDQQIGYRQGRRYAAHLSRMAGLSTEQPALAFHPDAGYLVTGGLGGLGLKVAAWLANHGAKHIALMGRSRGSEAARQAVAALEAGGVQVLLVQGDAGRAEDLRRVLGEISQAMPPLRGVIHSAGVVADALLVRQNGSGFEQVMASKVSAAWNLHELTQTIPLDFFVMFSSAASILGTPSQANYAAANAFLDALSFERRSAGLPCLVINWGAWAEIGLAVQQDRPVALNRLGIESFSPENGLTTMERLFHQAAPQAMVAAMKWGKFLEQRPGGSSCHFFAGLAPADRAEDSASNDSADPAGILQALEAANPADRAGLLSSHVQKIVEKVLSYDGGQALAYDQGFFKLGMDSLMAIDLKNQLQKSVGRSLRTTLAFDYPSVNLVTAYLLSELFPQAPVEADQAAAAPDLEEDLDDLSHDELKSLLDIEMRRLEDDL